jgi:hypothetical protein
MLADSISLLDAVGDRRVLFNERLAVARQLPQLADVERRDEAGLEQPVAQEVCEPGAVAHVRLPAGDGFDVSGVDEDDRERAFEDVEDGLPVDARTLDSDMGAAFRSEPVGEEQQVVGHRREGAGLALAVLDEAGDDRLGVHVEAAATRVDDLHGAPPAVVWEGRPAPAHRSMKSRLCVLAPSGGDSR